MKLFIATPAFEGKVCTQYSISLSELSLFLASQKIAFQIHLPSTGSLLVAERNRILHDFMQTDCTHILCIDSDIGWNYQTTKNFLEYDVDLIGACYLSRQHKEFFFRPVRDENNVISRGKNGLLKAEYIPAGFLLIKRAVIEKMNAHFPELYYENHENFGHIQTGFCLFNTEICDGQFWGEDYVFCRRVREAGFEILVDPNVILDHAGNRGALIQGLTLDASELLPHPN